MARDTSRAKIFLTIFESFWRKMPARFSQMMIWSCWVKWRDVVSQRWT